MNTEQEFERFKRVFIDKAINACEKFGYPDHDEPLCLLIEDAIDATKDFLDKGKPQPKAREVGE